MRFSPRWLLALPLAFSLLALGHGKEKEVDPKPALLKLADDIGTGGKNTAQLAKKVADLEPTHFQVMLPFKSRTIGGKPAKEPGYGVGAPGTFTPDGIEAMLITFDRKPPTARHMKAQQDIERAAQITVAVARTMTRMPAHKDDPKLWKRHVGNFNESSNKFLAAVKAGTPRKIQETARQVNNVCVECHEDFR